MVASQVFHVLRDLGRIGFPTRHGIGNGEDNSKPGGFAWLTWRLKIRYPKRNTKFAIGSVF